MKFYVGTSGWSYDTWAGKFYSEGVKAQERLAFYAKHFDAVELNNSFYHLPTREQIAAWQKEVPAHFTFAVKGSRYITHNKKLKDPEQGLSHMMGIFTRQRKIGPLVFQLPPRFGKNLGRLDGFLRALPKRRRVAMEFRDPSWLDNEVYALLKKHNVALCLFEKAELKSPRTVTADFTYVRLHGKKEGYKGNYNKPDLTDWVKWLKAQGQDAYMFFDNTDEKLYAIENALEFRKLTA